MEHFHGRRGLKGNVKIIEVAFWAEREALEADNAYLEVGKAAQNCAYDGLIVNVGSEVSGTRWIRTRVGCVLRRTEQCLALRG